MSKIRDYFTFTRSERNGILVLVLIILVLLVSLQIIPIISDRNQVDYTSFEKEVDVFISSLQDKESDSQNDIRDSSTTNEYFYFNPNTVSEGQLLKLGISKKVSRAWVNYISKGGRFNKKEDVKKIWGLEGSVYEKILPYMNIPDTDINGKFKIEYAQNENNSNVNWKNKSDFSTKKDNSVELNLVDSTGLCDLPGIGPGFTKRILKYRDLLGGFIAKEQLLEVFGFTMEMYSKIESLVYVEASTIKKININKAEFKQLIRHPYFTKEIINKILEYRRIQGKITNINDLVKDKMLTQEQCSKLKPYVDY